MTTHRRSRSTALKTGAKTAKTLDLLRRFESRNVTFLEPDDSWPIVWERARGVHVWDADGKRYLDLTAAFGVAAAGHGNARVVRAGQRQMQRLLHAMGDVHPHRLKAELACELSRITYERWTEGGTSSKTIFCNSGFEAVEAALKTAALVTKKPGVIAFTGGYHGLGYGALNVTHRSHFRFPFRSQLTEFGHFVEFPAERNSGPQVARMSPSPSSRPSPLRGRHVSAVSKESGAVPVSQFPENFQRAASGQAGDSGLSGLSSRIRQLCASESIGAILVEPVQGRGGIRIPPSGFLRFLRGLCNDLGILLICDEILTGFGRTGQWFACEHERVIPDIVCLGKALTGGFPLSVCVGKAELMDAAWPASTGEAIHTSTFLGHPVGCAMALAQINEIARCKLVARSAQLGQWLLMALREIPWPSGLAAEVRGLGLMAGIELRLSDGSPATNQAMVAIKSMLREGFILLPEGEHSNVISFTPPLNISKADLSRCVRALGAFCNMIGP